MNDDFSDSISLTLPVTTCGCHGNAVRQKRVMSAALIVCGLAAVTVGIRCLVLLAKPEFGIGPFTSIEGDGLAESFRGFRRMAFLTIGLGVATSLTGVILRSRSSPMKCGK